MTLAVAWLRADQNVVEMLVASDSRLRSALRWDCGPKILPLPRSDAALCFAGATLFAYPMLLQVQHATAAHYRYRSRRVDLYDFKGFVLDVLNQMRQEIVEDGIPLEVVAGEQPLFLLAGYSWRRASFALWTLHYDPNIHAFTFREHTDWEGVHGVRKVAFIGDGVPEAKTRLTAILTAHHKLTEGGFDYEPLEVLRDIIREEVFDTVGGPPQLVKIYRHLNVTPFGVFWPTKTDGAATLLGRTLLPFEKPDVGFIDPDTLEVVRLDDPDLENG